MGRRRTTAGHPSKPVHSNPSKDRRNSSHSKRSRLFCTNGTVGHNGINRTGALEKLASTGAVAGSNPHPREGDAPAEPTSPLWQCGENVRVICSIGWIVQMGMCSFMGSQGSAGASPSRDVGWKFGRSLHLRRGYGGQVTFPAGWGRGIHPGRIGSPLRGADVLIRKSQ